MFSFFSLMVVVAIVLLGTLFEFQSFSSYFKVLTGTRFLCLSLPSLFFFICPVPPSGTKGFCQLSKTEQTQYVLSSVFLVDI